MNPWLKPRGLSLAPNPSLRLYPERHSGRDDRRHDVRPLVAGLTFLHGKAIRCQNPYVANVQAVAPHYQGVPKQLQNSTSVLRWELAKWLGIEGTSLVFWRGECTAAAAGNSFLA
jgi:hypothetical protein